MEYLANVLIGNDIDHYNFEILDRDNERGGSSNQSQTNSARLYKLTSANGIVVSLGALIIVSMCNLFSKVRILDTPGLADTRGIEQDEHHRRNILAEIRKHINAITAVLVLLNGTVPRITIGTEYALSTLSAIFPKSLVENIAFVFTNVPSPLSWQFSTDTLPDVLRDAPQFFLDNPLALQKKYLSLKHDLKRKNARMPIRRGVLAGEERALEMLVNLFDWSDSLKSQPTTEIVYLYDRSHSTDRQPGGSNPRGPSERGPRGLITSSVLGPPPMKEQQESADTPACGKDVENATLRERRSLEDGKVDDKVDQSIK